MDHSGAVVLERPRSFTRRLVRHDSFSCLPDAQLAPRFPRFLVAGSIQNRSVLAEPSRQYHEAAPRLVRQPQVLPKVVSQLFSWEQNYTSELSRMIPESCSTESDRTSFRDQQTLLV